MKFKNATDKNHPLAVRFAQLAEVASQSIRAQWAAYENGGLEAFHVAHAVAKRACSEADDAEQACYDAGIAYAPYWHVTPKQMAAYAQNS